MATLQVCAIYDEKAEAYLHPFTVQAIGMATRDFLDALKDDQSPMSRHRSDFTLYHIALFDNASGVLDSIQPPRMIFKGADYHDEG